MLTAVHFTFMLHVLPYGWFAIILMLVLGVAFALVPSAMWPSVPKIIPMKLLGSAFAIIFYIQNIGLTLVPMWIGKMNGVDPTYKTSMTIFTCFGAISVLLALALLYMDKKKGYGLQKRTPNKRTAHSGKTHSHKRARKHMALRALLLFGLRKLRSTAQKAASRSKNQRQPLSRRTILSIIGRPLCVTMRTIVSPFTPPSLYVTT